MAYVDPDTCIPAQDCANPLTPAGFPNTDTCFECRCYLEISFDKGTAQWSVNSLSELAALWECAIYTDDTEPLDTWIYDGTTDNVCTWHLWSDECALPWDDDLVITYSWESPFQDLDTKTTFYAVDMATDVGWSCTCEGGVCNPYVEFSGDDTGTGGAEIVTVKAQDWFDAHPGQDSFTFDLAGCWYNGITTDGYYKISVASGAVVTFERQYNTSVINNDCCDNLTTSLTVNRNGTMSFDDSQDPDTSDEQCVNKTCPSLNLNYPAEYPDQLDCVTLGCCEDAGATIPSGAFDCEDSGTCTEPIPAVLFAEFTEPAGVLGYLLTRVFKLVNTGGGGCDWYSDICDGTSVQLYKAAGTNQWTMDITAPEGSFVVAADLSICDPRGTYNCTLPRASCGVGAPIGVTVGYTNDECTVFEYQEVVLGGPAKTLLLGASYGNALIYGGNAYEFVASSGPAATNNDGSGITSSNINGITYSNADASGKKIYTAGENAVSAAEYLGYKYTRAVGGLWKVYGFYATDPTVNDDSSTGWIAEAEWVNRATGQCFTATSVAVGAAVWTLKNPDHTIRAFSTATVRFWKGSVSTALARWYINGADQGRMINLPNSQTSSTPRTFTGDTYVSMNPYGGTAVTLVCSFLPL